MVRGALREVPHERAWVEVLGGGAGWRAWVSAKTGCRVISRAIYG